MISVTKFYVVNIAILIQSLTNARPAVWGSHYGQTSIDILKLAIVLGTKVSSVKFQAVDLSAYAKTIFSSTCAKVTVLGRTRTCTTSM